MSGGVECAIAMDSTLEVVAEDQVMGFTSEVDVVV
jgi:hypothetical protein